MARRIGEDAQMLSKSDHLHPLTGTEKPESSGPSAGPQYAALTHITSPYGMAINEYMSPMDAPPEAKHGDPKKPCRNRSTIRPAKLGAKAVGMDRMTNRNMVIM